MNRHFTFTEWLVVFAVLFFLVIQSADAKNKHRRKSHRKHTVKEQIIREYVPDTISVMVTNVTDGVIIRSQNIDQIRPLASMTKLMTAMVALDHDDDMNRKLVLRQMAGSKMPKREYTRGELFHMLLIKSDNAAAETLAADYPNGRDAFIRDMNIRAMMLTMYSTKFDDPSGLSPNNVSTASDVTQMVIAASKFGKIRDISTKKTATINILDTKRSRTMILHNTNATILSQIEGVQVSKTGYTNPAGFCVAILIYKQNGDKEYHEVIVVMGARNPSQRVDTVKRVSYNRVIGDNYATTSRF